MDTWKVHSDKINEHIYALVRGSTAEHPLWNVEHARGVMNEKGVHKPRPQPKWNYIDGCMVTALLSLYQVNGDKAILEFCDSFVSYYVSDQGSIKGYNVKDYNIDDINGGRNLLTLYTLTGKEKYKLAADVLYKQLQDQPRIDTGNFWHKGIYPHQVWLDGLYMAQVFYAMYEKQFNQSSNFSDIASQFGNIQRLMLDSDTQLYYHGYDSTKSIFWADKNTGLSKSFWLRSNGWLLCALVDTIEILGVQNPLSKDMVVQLNQLLDAIAHYAEEGMFYQVIDQIKREGNYLETSGSCMVAYAMLKAERLGLRQKDKLGDGQIIFESVCDRYLKEKEGKLSLGGIVLVSGLGPFDNLVRNGTFEYYISEPVVEDDAKGMMPFISAYVELLQKL